MHHQLNRYQKSLLWTVTLFLSMTATSYAQVAQEVVVGITPTCPYGLGACAVGAREGLKQLDGVQLVANTPDKYNCTFDILLKSAELPDIDRWKTQLKDVVGEAFVFRGVEVTIRGPIIERSGTLMLDAAGLKTPITFAPLENKLQWNFRKSMPRQPEPMEADAYQQLTAQCLKAPDKRAKFEITGPLRSTAQGHIVEVREFFRSEDP
jgi:galactose oxidase